MDKHKRFIKDTNFAFVYMPQSTIEDRRENCYPPNLCNLMADERNTIFAAYDSLDNHLLFCYRVND